MAGRVFYSAERDGKRYVGTIEQIAALVGKTEKYLYTMMERNSTTDNGWTVMRNAEYQWGYVAEKPGEDPIIGSATEVACILGVTSSYVYILAKSERKGKGGWRVHRRLIPGEY